jgi:hypothetical protein
VLKLTPRSEADSPAAKTATATAEPSAQKATMPPVPNPDPLPAPSGELPDTPTRETVQAALDSVRAEVGRCAPAGQRGVAEVDLTIASNGLVTHAVVAGDFAGTPAGSCIARAVRAARFTPFAKPRFRVIYPFSL